MSDDGYYEDRDYIYSYIDYSPNLPPHYADPDPLPPRPARRREGERRSRDGGVGDDESPKGLVGVKTVFGSIVFTALATSVVNPSLLIYTLPLTTLVVTMLALTGRGRKRREPRRLMPCSDM